MCALRDRTARPPEYLGCVTAFRTRGSIPCAAMRLSLHEKRRDHFRHAFCLFNCLTNTPLIPRFFVHVTPVFCTRYPVKLYTLPRFFVHIHGRAQMPENADKIRVFGAFLRADFFAVGTVRTCKYRSSVARLLAAAGQRLDTRQKSR